MLAGAPIAYASPAQAQYVLNLRGTPTSAPSSRTPARHRTHLHHRSAVQGRVSVVTDRPLASRIFRAVPVDAARQRLRRGPDLRRRAAVQPIAGAASSAPVGGSARQRERLRHRDLARPQHRAGAAVETLRPLVSRDGLDHRRAELDRRLRLRRQCPPHPPGARPDRRRQRQSPGWSASTMPARARSPRRSPSWPRGRDRRRRRQLQRAALRGDARSVAQLAAIAEELDHRAASGSEIRVVYLEHADAEQLLPVLQQLLGQAPTQPTTRRAPAPRPDRQQRRWLMQADQAAAPAPAAVAAARRASPLACATRSSPASRAPTRSSSPRPRMCSARIGEVIRQLDVRRQQVLVEAIIVEISTGAAQQLGVQLFLRACNGSDIPFAVTNYSNIAAQSRRRSPARAAESARQPPTRRQRRRR